MYKGTKYRALKLKLGTDSARAFISLADRQAGRRAAPLKYGRRGDATHRIFYAGSQQEARNVIAPRRAAEHMPQADATKEVVDIRGPEAETGTSLSRLD